MRRRLFLAAGLWLWAPPPAPASGAAVDEARAALRGGDASRAAELLKEAAEEGDGPAQALLGLLYARGQGVPRNGAKAERWFRRAAGKEDPDGQFGLGVLYLEGTGVSKNRDEALRWLRAAAEQGHLEAATLLERLGGTRDAVLGRGQLAPDPGGKLDLLGGLDRWEAVPGPQQREAVSERVERLREQAAASDSEAQLQLALAYERGEGTERDGKAALRWFERAANQGHPRAQYLLGLRYLLGTAAIAKDRDRAEGWLGRAAAAGEADAAFQLAETFLRESETRPEALESAAQWYRRAAERSHAEAQARLGALYLDGKGVARDGVEASRWFRRAASQGNPAAQYQLGVQLALGVDLPRNTDAALKWLEAAGAGGHPFAQAKAEEIRMKLLKKK